MATVGYLVMILYAAFALLLIWASERVRREHGNHDDSE